MHDRGLGGGQPEGGQGHVPVQEPALVDQAEDLGLGHRLLLPFRGPVVEDELGDVPGALVRREQVLLRLTAHQD